MALSIRSATAADTGLVERFVRALAEYERLTNEVKAGAADFARELFGANPKVFCEIAEWDGAPAGFAIWFYTFSTFEGRHGIWLEDLFVDPAFRGKGIGKGLLVNLAQRCVREDLKRFDRLLQGAGRAHHGGLGALPGRRQGSAEAWDAVTVSVAMIAAVAANGVIGRAGGIPWRIPSDMAFFKRMTMGKPIVMGRKQYESVGRPLPGRTNIVVTRQANYRPDGVIVIDGLEAALLRARAIAEADGKDEAMIIGGGEIYAQGIVSADKLYISHVDLRPEGDVFFPPIDAGLWTEVEAPPVIPDPRDEAVYRIAIYARRRQGPPLIRTEPFPI
jgi:dihydrofolate reductase